MSWGRPLPKDVKAVSHWGARAIFTANYKENPVIDLLPDRQSLRLIGSERPYTPEQETLLDPLLDWMNKTGLPWMRKRAALEFESSSGECRTLSFDDGRFHIEADPQGSYGYLYLGAWEVA